MTVWRSIPGLQNYDASDDGQVRSWCPYRGLPVPHALTQTLSRGYLLVRVGRAINPQPVHRLVMLAFVGPRPEGQEVRHLDGDPTNNRLGNLAYGTPSENSYDAIRHGTHPTASKTHCPAGHAYDEQNTYRSPRGDRRCRACNEIRERKRHQREGRAHLLISQLPGGVMQKDIAAKYDVHASYVGRLLRQEFRPDVTLAAEKPGALTSTAR